MKINEYVEQAARTDHTPETRENAASRHSSEVGFDMNHAILGLITEVGELADFHKKAVHYGKDADWWNAAEEIGDIMWFVALAARVVGHHTGKTLEDILQMNIDKLKARYPDSFSGEQAINRDTDAERVVLEAGTAGDTVEVDDGVSRSVFFGICCKCNEPADDCVPMVGDKKAGLVCKACREQFSHKSLLEAVDKAGERRDT